MPTYDEIRKKKEEILKILPSGFQSNVTLKCPDCGSTIPISVVITRMNIEVYRGVIDRKGALKFHA